MMDRQPDPRGSTPRAAYQLRTDEHYNWPAKRGAGQIVELFSTMTVFKIIKSISDSNDLVLTSALDANRNI